MPAPALSVHAHVRARTAHPIDTKPQDELSKKQQKKKKLKELEAKERALAQKAQVATCLPRLPLLARFLARLLAP